MFGTAAAAAVVVVFSQEEAKLKKVFFLLLRTTTNNNTRTISMGTGACNLYGDTSESRRPSSFSSCVYFLATSIDQKKKKTPLRFFSLSLSFFLILNGSTTFLGNNLEAKAVLRPIYYYTCTYV